MHIYILLGIAVLVGFLLFARWYASATPSEAMKILKWIGIFLFVLIAGFFVLTGRLGWVFFAIPALIPWFMRARALARTAKAFSRMSQANAGTGSGETSEVETRFFTMTLDHDSGNTSGFIREGIHSGKSIDQLTTVQLIELLQVCQREDQDSARILEAYMDRNRPDWHDSMGSSDKTDSRHQGASMGRSEALQVLGLSEGASSVEIKEAHRKLISGMHPDRGGSDYLAAQINQAKDVLLGDRK